MSSPCRHCRDPRQPLTHMYAQQPLKDFRLQQKVQESSSLVLREGTMSWTHAELCSHDLAEGFSLGMPLTLCTPMELSMHLKAMQSLPSNSPGHTWHHDKKAISDHSSCCLGTTFSQGTNGDFLICTPRVQYNTDHTAGNCPKVICPKATEIRASSTMLLFGLSLLEKCCMSEEGKGH